jgi:molybdate transport system permease protein
MRTSDRLMAVGTGVATAVVVGFVGLPLLAIFLRVPVGTLAAQLHSPVALDALKVSIRTSFFSLALILVFGTPVAYRIATRPFPGSTAVTVLLELPLVLPPAVAGIALFAAFGRAGLLGKPLQALGIELPFTQTAVVMAVTFVSMPFFVRQAIAGFSSLDRQLLGASRTLGAGEARTFLHVGIPLARQSLSAGAVLAFARALGEFGATIMFAGSLQGATQTLPLAVYGQFSSGNLDLALALAALLLAVAIGLFAGARVLIRVRDKDNGEPWTPSSRSGSVIV